MQDRSNKSVRIPHDGVQHACIHVVMSNNNSVLVRIQGTQSNFS